MKCEGPTKRISALALDRMDQIQQVLYIKDGGLILSQYGPK